MKSKCKVSLLIAVMVLSGSVHGGSLLDYKYPNRDQRVSPEVTLQLVAFQELEGLVEADVQGGKYSKALNRAKQYYRKYSASTEETNLKAIRFLIHEAEKAQKRTLRAAQIDGFPVYLAAELEKGLRGPNEDGSHRAKQVAALGRVYEKLLKRREEAKALYVEALTLDIDEDQSQNALGRMSWMDGEGAVKLKGVDLSKRKDKSGVLEDGLLKTVRGTSDE